MVLVVTKKRGRSGHHDHKENTKGTKNKLTKNEIGFSGIVRRLALWKCVACVPQRFTLWNSVACAHWFKVEVEAKVEVEVEAEVKGNSHKSNVIGLLLR